MPISHKWAPIEDLADAATLSDGELLALIAVWKDQSAALSATDSIARFSEQLNREWAIETGIIERAYTLDRGTTIELIEKGIEASLIPRGSTDRDPEEVAAILQDHLDALEGMFALVKGERDLTVGYINELHSALLRHVHTYVVRDSLGNISERELPKGMYKKQANSPTRPDGSVHEYCPPEHVASEMDRMIEIHDKHVTANLPPEIQAAWLHHAFTQIHPFADGNGRVARTLASLVFVKAGGFPLVIRREDHTRYIEALERADARDIRPLIELFLSAERRVLISALQALPRTAPSEKHAPRTPEEAIAGIRDFLVDRGDVMPKSWEAADPLRATILNQANQRLGQVAAAMGTEVSLRKPEFRFLMQPPIQGAALAQSMKSVRTVAEAFGYELVHDGSPDVRRFTLEPGATHVMFALDRAGRAYRGVVLGMLISVGADGSAKSATTDIFQLNYKDNNAALQARFRRWFDNGLTRALEMWRAEL